MALLTPSLVRLGAAPATKEQAITDAGSMLLAAGYIDAAYVRSLLAREEVANTFEHIEVLRRLTRVMGHAAGVELRVRHGGAFVLRIPNAVTHLGTYVVALVVGAIATALTLRVTLKPVP